MKKLLLSFVIISIYGLVISLLNLDYSKNHKTIETDNISNNSLQKDCCQSSSEKLNKIISKLKN